MARFLLFTSAEVHLLGDVVLGILNIYSEVGTICSAYMHDPRFVWWGECNHDGHAYDHLMRA